eukprot:753404-Hanusia_phi.AAC.6
MLEGTQEKHETRRRTRRTRRTRRGSCHQSGGETRRKLYLSIKKLGITLSCASPVISKQFKDVIGTWLTYSPEQSLIKTNEELLKKISMLKFQFDAVTTFDEFGVQLASMLAASLDLPGIPLQVVQCCQNKTSFREFCRSKALPFARFASLSCGDSIHSAEIKYPAVLKPANGAGSHFVQRVDNAAQLRDAMLQTLSTLRTRSLKSYEWCDHNALNDLKFHVEELIQGKEVDVDCVLCGNQIRYCNVVDNQSSGCPYFLEDTCQAPSSLPLQTQRELCVLTAQIFDAMAKEWDCNITGTFHVEMILTEDGPVPIEVNCRLGGAETRCLHLTAWDVDLGIETVLAHLNISSPQLGPFANYCSSLLRRTGTFFEDFIHHRQFACSANLHPNTSGVVMKTDLPLDRFGYVDHMLYFQQGEEILVPPSGFQYLGWVVIQGRSEEEARGNLTQFLECSKIEVQEC